MADIAHRGEAAFAVAQQVKAMLTPLENVCRYREQRDSETATYEVTRAPSNALPFRVDIAPGGINVVSEAFTIRDLPLEQDELALALVHALLAGRVHQVRLMGSKGAMLAEKTYVFGEAGELLYRHKRKAGFRLLSQRRAGFVRKAFSPFA